MTTSGDTTSRRPLVVAVLVCLLLGGMDLFAGGRVWVHFVATTAAGAPLAADATGHQVAAGAYASGFVVLAGVVALPAARGVLRRVIGGLIALAGAGMAFEAVPVARAPAAAVRQRAIDVSGLRPPHLADASPTGWPVLVAVLGGCVVALGMFVILRSAHWPAMGRRYDPVGAGTRRAYRRPETPSPWDQLDRGQDPTI
ncbi:MAG: Trp biosynthesis-associated membrane protein [Acidothermus sp.]|nr:Trp biosynthesis-associated membrane protein [Acidothermus sp.]